MASAQSAALHRLSGAMPVRKQKRYGAELEHKAKTWHAPRIFPQYQNTSNACCSAVTPVASRIPSITGAAMRVNARPAAASAADTSRVRTADRETLRRGEGVWPPIR
jgi:hypothetical protein